MPLPLRQTTDFMFLALNICNFFFFFWILAGFFKEISGNGIRLSGFRVPDFVIRFRIFGFRVPGFHVPEFRVHENRRKTRPESRV